jgi:hypothetical protein
LAALARFLAAAPIQRTIKARLASEAEGDFLRMMLRLSE